MDETTLGETVLKHKTTLNTHRTGPTVRQANARTLVMVVILLLCLPSASQAQADLTTCNGPYALCAAASCRPIPQADSNGNSIDPTYATCECVLAEGENIGPGSCEARVAGMNEGRPISTYSFGLVATHPSMVCERGDYTNCFGYPCVVDEEDPTRATCTCAIVPNEENEPFVTQGGGCNLESCATTLWSAAPVGGDLLANKELATTVGLDQPPSNWCPEAQQTAQEENLCADYCYQVMGEPGVCTEETGYAIYKNVEECLSTCATTFPTDASEGAVAGDSVQCRTEHAILAQGPEGPAKHCPHAAPGGGGVCVDRSPCEAYCVFYYDRVEEGECPKLEELWGTDIGYIDDNNIFHPNPKCMETCSTFAGAGQAWEMSGDSANCRMEFYLMAHRRAQNSESYNQAELDDLCHNANPVNSTMCQGSTFDEYYKVRATNPCQELCYNDRLTCNGSYGTEDQCLATCNSFPYVGERQTTTGDSVNCRLTWAQYAFFVVGDQREMFCSFAQANSLVCRDPGESSEEGTSKLPDNLRKALMGH